MAKTSSENNSYNLNSVPLVGASVPMENIEDTNFIESSQNSTSKANWWQKKSIRWKATILAIAIGTLPTASVGILAYWAANRSINQEITSVRKTLATDLQNEVNLFMEDRFKDIQILSQLDILTDSQLRSSFSDGQKTQSLEKILATYNIYNSIGVFDLKGDVIAQTGNKPLGNHLNRGYIQAALKQDRAIISQPRISTSSGIYSIYTAAPVKDKTTGKTIAVIRARIPVAVLDELLGDFSRKSDRYYLLDENDTIFLGSEGEYVIQTLSNEQNSTQDTAKEKQKIYQSVSVTDVFPKISSILDSSTPANLDTVTQKGNPEKQFLTFAPSKKVAGVPDLNWQIVLATDNKLVFAPQRRLAQIYTLGTLVVAIVTGICAYYLVNLATKPIFLAASTVNEIGKGNLQARISNIAGTDEIAALANNINGMAVKLEQFVWEQNILAEQTKTLKETVLIFSQIADTQNIGEIATAQIKAGLGSSVEGVSFYSLEEGKVVSESLAKDAVSLRAKEVYEAESIEGYLKDSVGGVVVMENFSQTDLTPSQLNKLEGAGIRAIAFSTVKQQGKPLGLLIAHQSWDTQPWLKSDLDFLEQVTNQVNSTLDRLSLIQQQKAGQTREREAREFLQRRAFELLQQVDEVAQGDLTIRARVTEDEIGTIADSYNATIYSLQKLVDKVKKAAGEVEQTAGSNQNIIDKLATEATEQAQSIAITMQQINRMTQSIDGVSGSASQAEQIVKQAHETIVLGDTSMNQAVHQINALQNTVDRTEEKVKVLGESSQEISQVVNSISRFAAQTHLLALKASIEAARAGEQGKGFATIADEVRSLATQSATASSDIENLVAKIQLETSEVVNAMAQGAEQVALGTQLVRETRQSLSRVTTASEEIGELVTAIAESAQGQANISQQVSKNIASVAVSAQTNSQSATEVSLQIEQLLTVAHQLQTDIDRFKT